MNSHTRWLMIKQGLTNVHDKEWNTGSGTAYVKDISDDEATLIFKPKSGDR